MKRRALVVAASFAWALPLAVQAQASTARASTATQRQIDLALAAVGLAALRTRYGTEHPDRRAAEARVAALTSELRAAIARHEPIDVAAVESALQAELADVVTRLAEFSQRCGAGHPDMQTAHARRTALEDAIAHVTSDGVFLPAP